MRRKDLREMRNLVRQAREVQEGYTALLETYEEVTEETAFEEEASLVALMHSMLLVSSALAWLTKASTCLVPSIQKKAVTLESCDITVTQEMHMEMWSKLVRRVRAKKEELDLILAMDALPIFPVEDGVCPQCLVRHEQDDDGGGMIGHTVLAVDMVKAHIDNSEGTVPPEDLN
jgi:hypothetical protein